MSDVAVTISGESNPSVTISRQINPSVTITEQKNPSVTISEQQSNSITVNAIPRATVSTEITSNDAELNALNTATGLLSTATGLLVPKSETGSFLTSGQISTNISTAVSNLVDSAPDALNTLNELASGLGNDANFSATITNSLSNKANKSETGSFAVTGSDVTFSNLTVAGNILPDVNIAYDIGSPSKRFKDLYLSGNSIFLGESTLSFASNKLNIAAQGLTGSFIQDAQTGDFASASSLDVATGALSTATGVLNTNVSSLQTATGALSTATGNLDSKIITVSGLIVSNDTELTALNTATGLLNTATGILNTNVISLNTATGLLVQKSETGVLLTSGEIQTNIDTAVANLVDSAPGTLNTLNELAAALGDDQNFSTTTATSLGNLSTATGNLDTRVTSNDSDINSLQTATGLLDADINTVSGLITSNDSDISALQAVTGSFAQTGSATFGLLNVTGDVGIGTTSPQAKLHVAGDTIVSGGNLQIGSTPAYSQTRSIKLHDNGVQYAARVSLIGTNDNGGPGLEMVTDGSLSKRTIIRHEGEGSNDYGLAFFTTNNGTTSEKVRFDGNGGVGIGTNSPLAKLHVNGDTILSGNLDISGSITPAKDVAFDIGSPTKRFKDLYLSGDSIFLGETRLSISGDELQTRKDGVVRRAPLRDSLNQTTNLIVTGNAVLGKCSLSANSFVTETGDFTLGLNHRGATVLLQNPASITITCPAVVPGHVTTFIAETHNPVSFITGAGMSGLNSFNGAGDIAGIYGQAQVIYKSAEYAFLGGNVV